MQEILNNKVLIVTLISWFVAGFIKLMIDLWINKKFDYRRFFGAGGMPSQHTATVVSLCIATAFYEKLLSTQFAITFFLAIIVMHDAMGVRLETGKQAKILNKMMENPIFASTEEEFEKRLKEYIGHTPLQVVCGAIVAIVVSIITINILK